MSSTEHCTKVTNGTSVSGQNGGKCAGCWPSWWGCCLEAAAPNPGRGSHCVSPARERVQTQNSKHGLHWSVSLSHHCHGERVDHCKSRPVCRYWTVESRHTHLELARILSRVLHKKRKNSNHVGTALLVARGACPREGNVLCLEPAPLVCWGLWKDGVNDSKGLIQEVKPFFLVAGIRVVIEESKELVECD